MKPLKLDFKTLPKKILPFIGSLRRHLKIIFAALLMLIYGFLIVRVGLLSKIEPSESQVEEVTKDVRKPRVDKDAVAKIQQLEDQNIQVQTLFKEARDNPFSE